MRNALPAALAVTILSLSPAGCGTTHGPMAPASAGAAPAPPGEPPAPGTPGDTQAATETSSEMHTISGEVAAVSNDVGGLTAAIRAHAAELRGSVAREDVSGDAQHRQASIALRLPPAALAGFVDWLAARATIDTSHVEDNDVSRQYFDRDVAIRNLEVTLERLRELARQPDAELSDVMQVERELTRVRGDLERLRGEQRLLADRVARATLAITLSITPGLHAEPALKFELVPHLTRLRLVDAGPRAADRIGGGVTLMGSRAASVDFEVLAPSGDDARSYLLTFATGLYSDFLGGGQRRFLNPYVGARLGGAKMNGHGAFAYGVDAGVELVRFRMFLVEVAGRAVGLWYNRDNPPKNDLLLEATVGVGVPF
jgi:hypothetical protein